MGKSAVAERPAFDLNKAAGRQAMIDIFVEGDKDDRRQDVDDFVSLDEYLKTGAIPSVRFGTTLIFDVDGEIAYVNKGIVYRSQGVRSVFDNNNREFEHVMTGFAEEAIGPQSEFRDPAKSDCPVVGFIFERPMKIGNEKYKMTLMRRGNEENEIGEANLNMLVASTSDQFPTISASCMAQMFYDNGDEENVIAVARRVAIGDLELVDFIPDEEKSLTESQKKQWRKYRDAKSRDDKTVLPPKGTPGFTIVDGKWHCAATVLLRDIKAETSYIFGQDENTYFGCQLQDNPSTVDHAFTSLIPEEIRGKSIKRQGEGFMIVVSEKQVPDHSECIAVLPDGAGLPIEGKESNIHTLSRLNDEPARIARDGTIYAANGTLSHDEHAEMSFDGWVRFYRNTAAKSVSANKNVD